MQKTYNKFEIYEKKAVEFLAVYHTALPPYVNFH